MVKLKIEIKFKLLLISASLIKLWSVWNGWVCKWDPSSGLIFLGGNWNKRVMYIRNYGFEVEIIWVIYYKLWVWNKIKLDNIIWKINIHYYDPVVPD